MSLPGHCVVPKPPTWATLTDQRSFGQEKAPAVNIVKDPFLNQCLGSVFNLLTFVIRFVHEDATN
jgi:hypothetical protein